MSSSSSTPSTRISNEQKLLKFLKLREEARLLREQAQSLDEEARAMKNSSEFLRSMIAKIDRESTEKPSKKRKAEKEEKSTDKRMDVDQPQAPIARKPKLSSKESRPLGIVEVPLHYHTVENGEREPCRLPHNEKKDSL